MRKTPAIPQQNIVEAEESAGGKVEEWEEGMGNGWPLLDDRWKIKGASATHGKCSSAAW